MTTIVIEGTKTNGEPFKKEVKKEIQGLNLSWHQLSSVDLAPLAKCQKLQGLNLWGNQLSSVDLAPLAKCQKLQGLNLSDNQLSSVDLSPLAKCQKLQKLYLDSSTIIHWENDPLEIDKLPQGLQKYREKIQRAHKESVKEPKRQKQKRDEALQLAEQGQKALTQEELDQARIFFEQAQQLDPELIQVKEGLQKLEKKEEQQLKKQRPDKLRKILKKTKRLPLKRLARHLDFADTFTLEEWIFELPDELEVVIEGDDVLFGKDLQSGSEEAEAAIDELIQQFEAFERSGKGKKD